MLDLNVAVFGVWYRFSDIVSLLWRFRQKKVVDVDCRPPNSDHNFLLTSFEFGVFWLSFSTCDTHLSSVFDQIDSNVEQFLNDQHLVLLQLFEFLLLGIRFNNGLQVVVVNCRSTPATLLVFKSLILAATFLEPISNYVFVNDPLAQTLGWYCELYVLFWIHTIKSLEVVFFHL